MTEPDAGATAALATLDSATSTAYEALRTIGLSIEAAKDALTVHVSDALVACQTQRGELPTDDGEGGIGIEFGVHVR